MSDNRLKRTLREDSLAKATRIVRDRAYRSVGRDASDPEYVAIKWALAEVRAVARG